MMYIVFISLQIPKGRLSSFQTTPSPQQNNPMAVNKIARKSSKFRVVFTVPDFCWPTTPAPPSVPPIPFPLFADLGGAKTVAKDVRLNRKPAFVFKASKTDKTYGDEIALPGRKGVKSRTELPTHHPRCGRIGLYRQSGPSVPFAGSG